MADRRQGRVNGGGGRRGGVTAYRKSKNKNFNKNENKNKGKSQEPRAILYLQQEQNEGGDEDKKIYTNIR